MNHPPLRVVFCGCSGLFSGLVLRRLLACPSLEVVAVVRSTRVLHARYGFLRGAWQQIRRCGPAYAAYLWMATTGTEVLCTAALHRLTRRHRIPTLATRSVNNAAALAFVAAARPDLLVSAFFNQRIGDAVSALPRAAALNVHPSLLPDFKGVDPVFFARLSQAPALGVTVHQLSAEFDAGPILLQERLPVGAAKSLFRTTARLFDLGGRLLTASLAHQTLAPDDSWPATSQVREFRKQGTALVRLTDLAWARRTQAGDDRPSGRLSGSLPLRGGEGGPGRPGKRRGG